MLLEIVYSIESYIILSTVNVFLIGVSFLLNDLVYDIQFSDIFFI